VRSREEVELAWSMRGAESAPWLAVASAEGSATTVRMLRAAGLRTPEADVELAETAASDAYDVVVLELPMPWPTGVVPHAVAVLDLADSAHVPWPISTLVVGNVDQPEVLALLASAPGRQIGFTLESPRRDQVGVVEHLLVDRAFVDDPDHGAEELATLDDVLLPGSHNVANALAAAALARAFGVPTAAVRDGLRAVVDGDS
jgi:UDP-N-acetylmuramoylalanine--D-glutamate ligase